MTDWSTIREDTRLVNHGGHTKENYILYASFLFFDVQDPKTCKAASKLTCLKPDKILNYEQFGDLISNRRPVGRRMDWGDYGSNWRGVKNRTLVMRAKKKKE